MPGFNTEPASHESDSEGHSVSRADNPEAVEESPEPLEIGGLVLIWHSQSPLVVRGKMAPAVGFEPTT
jgi:hypothetical protein